MKKILISIFIAALSLTGIAQTTIDDGATGLAVRNILNANIQKFNVVDFGADSTGVVDATEAIQATCDAAYAATNGKVYGPPGDYLISSAITIRSDADFTGATFNITGTTDTAVIFFDVGPQILKGKQVIFPRVIQGTAPTGGAWTGTSVGVAIVNSYNNTFYAPYIEDFVRGLLFTSANPGATEYGCSHNILTFGDIIRGKIGLALSPADDKGYVNSNLITGGRIKEYPGYENITGHHGIVIDSTALPLDNNRIVGVSMDGDSWENQIEVYGYNNTFVDMRLEPSDGVTYPPNVLWGGYDVSSDIYGQANLWIGGYQPQNIIFTRGTDGGTTHAIISPYRTVLHGNPPLTLQPASALGDPAITIVRSDYSGQYDPTSTNAAYGLQLGYNYIRGKQNSQTNPQWGITEYAGNHEWGPGNVVYDTKLYRSGVATLRIENDLIIDNDIFITRAIDQVQISYSLTDGAPTSAEIDAATGRSAAGAGSGYQLSIKDNDGSGLTYRIESDGTSWYYAIMSPSSAAFSALIDHDAGINYAANEHRPWEITGAEDIHADRVSETSVTQHSTATNALVDHDGGINFVEAEHRNWSNETNNIVTTGNASVDDLTTTGNITAGGEIIWKTVTLDSMNVDQAGTALKFFVKYNGVGPQFAFTVTEPQVSLEYKFIDATDGDDNADGISPSTAWQSITKVNATSKSAGDKFYFKRGETWSDELVMTHSGSSGNPIVFSAYGNGAKPIITMRHAVSGWDSDVNWTQSGSYWYMSTSEDVRRLWVNGTEVKEVDEDEDNEGNLTSELLYYHNAGTDVLYYYSATNPASTFSSMEQLDMNDGALIGANISYVKFEYMAFEGANYTVRVNGGDNWHFDSCDIGKDGFYGLRFDGASYTSVDDMLVEDCYFDPNDTLWYTTHNNKNVEDALWAAGPLNNLIIRRCTFKNWSHDGVNLYSQIADTSDMYEDVYIYDNFFTGPDVTYGRALDIQSTLTSSLNINIYNNYVYNMATGSQIISSNTNFYNNIIDVIRGDVYGYMSWGTEGMGVGISPYRGGNITGNVFNNNIIMRCAEWALDIRSRNGSLSKIHGNEFSNNIFAFSHYDLGPLDHDYNTGDHQQMRVLDDAGTDKVFQNTYKNNIFYDTSATSGTDLIYYTEAGGDYKINITEFNLENGTLGDVISGNLGTNPEFVDAGSNPTTNDYHIYTTSDGNAGGVDVSGYTLDKDGITVSSPPNIGVYETIAEIIGDWFVAPDGNDGTGDGSIVYPYFTLEKAWAEPSLAEGDTIYVRDGLFEWDNQQLLSGKNGSAGNYINVWAYPGETPVFTKHASYSSPAIVNSARPFIALSATTYVYLKGLTVTGYDQPSGDGNIWAGIYLRSGSDYNIIEQCIVSEGGGGLYIHNSGFNQIINSDFNDHEDPYTAAAYDNADGLWIAQNADVNDTTWVSGCRMWENSDDGIDFYNQDGFVFVDDSWSFRNGFRRGGWEQGGNGHGFKLGSGGTGTASDTIRKITNSISAINRSGGFSEEEITSSAVMYNDIAYANATNSVGGTGSGFEFWGSSIAHWIKNCISFDNNDDYDLPSDLTNIEFNDWNLGGVTITNADWVSIDTTFMDSPREEDGSLPYAASFFFPAIGSDIIDAATTVGITFNGAAPDLGAKESDY